MQRIIHISDFHFGYGNLAERFSIIIDKIKKHIKDTSFEYILIITGDLVDNAHNKRNYQNVKDGLDKLVEAGVKHILVVPGNHDYGSGNWADNAMVAQFQERFYGDSKGFPRVDIIDDIAFIGLDSMAARINGNAKPLGQGEIGSQQLTKLREVLKQDDIKGCQKRVVYLHHHPFALRPFHTLKDAAKLKEVLVEAKTEGTSIDAILYGHNHRGKDNNGRWGIPRCYDAGTVTLKPKPVILNWIPGLRVKSSTRIININGEVDSDYKLSL